MWPKLPLIRVKKFPLFLIVDSPLRWKFIGVNRQIIRFRKLFLGVTGVTRGLVKISFLSYQRIIIKWRCRFLISLTFIQIEVSFQSVQSVGRRLPLITAGRQSGRLMTLLFIIIGVMLRWGQETGKLFQLITSGLLSRISDPFRFVLIRFRLIINRVILKK